MDESFFLERLRALSRRYRTVLLYERVLSYGIYSTFLTILLLLALKIAGFTLPVVLYTLIPPGMALCIPIILFFFQKIPLMHVALKADESLHLKERLSTVLEWIEEKKKRTLMFKGLLKDTSESIRTLNPSTTFTVKVKRIYRAFFATIPLIVLLLLIPSWGIVPLARNYEDKKKIALAAKKLDTIAANLEAIKAPDPLQREDLRRKAEDFRQLARDLKKPGVHRKEAIARISGLSDTYRQEKKSIEALKSKLEKMKRAMDSRSGPSSKERELLSRKIKEMADTLKGNRLEKPELEHMKEQLSRLKESLKSTDAMKKDLEEALSSLQKGDLQDASRKLDQVADTLQKIEQKAAGEKALHDMAERLSSCKNSISGSDDSSARELAKSGKEGNQEDRSTDGEEHSGDEQGEGPLEKGDAKETGAMTKNYTVTDSEDRANPDFGKGTTNKEQKAGEGTSKDLLKRQSERRGHWKEFYEKLYSPAREKMESADTRVKGQRTGKGGTPVSELRGGVPVMEFHGNDPGKLYTVSRSRAEEALHREKIPGEYKKLVRNYFKEIDPSR